MDTSPSTLAPAVSDPTPPPQRQPLHWQVLHIASAYLPVLLMALLAMGTWWLVKNTGPMADDRPATAPRPALKFGLSSSTITASVSGSRSARISPRSRAARRQQWRELEQSYGATDTAA